MGFYDSEHSSSEEPRRSGPRRGGWFLAGLVGAIVGVVVMLVLTPVLSNLGFLPYNVNTQGQTDVTGPTTTKNVKVDVNSAVTKAVSDVSPAVVGVINEQKGQDFFSALNDQYSEAALGSGIVYKKDNNYAYVVTNNHVVEGASKVQVQLDNNTKVNAQILGKDALYDLAVLRIPADKVKKVAQFGDSSDLKRGEPVVAIGNPLGFSGTVTEGIVSSNNRVIPSTHGNVSYQAPVIQTDAAINPGNSGGALVNIEGQVIGINSSKISEQDVEGIGFAIPINVAKPVIQQLETNGKVERAYLGLQIIDLSMIPAGELQKLKVPANVKSGLIVAKVSNGSPADKGGLEAGDVITEVNGKKITSYIDFSTYLYTKLKPGDTVNMKVYRFGKEKNVSFKLGGKEFS
ncbi:serine protease Do [Scopulibacillus daqui]|uniref:Serine protease Do n=1 Tax=Scopulibacillus daqui TaxID=1469162 RepID=A0ABS2PZY8_9BACL|nr:trypsin-like peptidase domain-containing protein [Scopulibacillus daqui]MBM7645503.1 serine protease Do [Scopulibacillus daqui]